MSANLCPVCHRPFELSGIQVFPAENLIVIGDRFARLQPQWVVIAAKLVAAMPRTVSKAELMDALYGRADFPAKPPLKILDIFICKLRQACRHLPVLIVTTRSVGWRIELTAAAGAAARPQAEGGDHAALR